MVVFLQFFSENGPLKYDLNNKYGRYSNKKVAKRCT